MTLPDPLDYWQSSDDPNWSDEREAQFLRALSSLSINHAFRPGPDADDADVHPETLRGKILAYYAERDRVLAQIPRPFRWLFRRWFRL